MDDRLFISEKVEAVIVDVGSRIKDDTIRTIFTNCLPSTLGKTHNIRSCITISKRGAVTDNSFFHFYI